MKLSRQLNIHAWSSGILEGILHCGLSVTFMTKSGRLAPPLEELTHASVATPAAEASTETQSKGHWCQRCGGFRCFQGRGQTLGGMYPGQGLLLLCSFPPSAPWHSSWHCQPGKEVLGKWCVCACKIPCHHFFKIHKMAERPSVIKSASF